MYYYSLFLHVIFKLHNMNLKIKEIIKSKGETIQSIAEIIGINRVSLTNSINGNPTLETLEKIAEALGVKITDLFEDASGTIGVIRHNDKSYEINSIHDIERVLEEIKKSDI